MYCRNCTSAAGIFEINKIQVKFQTPLADYSSESCVLILVLYIHSMEIFNWTTRGCNCFLTANPGCFFVSLWRTGSWKQKWSSRSEATRPLTSEVGHICSCLTWELNRRYAAFVYYYAFPWQPKLDEHLCIHRFHLADKTLWFTSPADQSPPNSPYSTHHLLSPQESTKWATLTCRRPFSSRTK